jgi:hypothetical protein
MKKLRQAFLVLSAGLVSGLILVAVASGSQAQVTQKAIEAPRPAGAGKKAGLVEQVACASAKSCAAFGVSLYTEQGGRWKAVQAPSLAHVKGTGLRALACPSAGKCQAVAIAGAHHLVRLAQSGSHWSLKEIALPANAAPIDPPQGPYPGITLSCATAGTCAAVGGYFASDHTTDPLLVIENNGTWGTATAVPLPPDASTAFPPPDGESFAGGFLSFASCPSAGSCTTVGTYTREPNGAANPWRLDEVGGQWVAATTGLQLPTGAATGVDSRGGGSSPFMGFSGLSCPSAGNCTAVGGYVDLHSDFQGAIFAEHDGVWSKGVKAPVPAAAGNYTDAMELLNPLNSVSCSTANDCAAVGSFVKGGDKGDSETPHGLLLAEHHGAWKASPISLPRGANASGGVYLTSVSCPAAGNCVAVGYYASHGKTHGLVVRERGGKWQRAVSAALPRGAAPAMRAHTFLNSVTCPSASACMVGGSYSDRSGKTQGLLLSVRLR